MGQDTLPCLSQASFWTPRHIEISAWLEHAPFAFWLIQAQRPQTIVELGVHHGFSYLTFCQAVSRLGLPARCFAIDTWAGDEHAGYYSDDVFARLQRINHAHYAGFSQLIRGRFDQALPAFPDGGIDLLHIDGRHRYEDVVEDFTQWHPKLSARGVVLFHDTAVRDRDFGVWRVWQELSVRFPSFEFPHGNGLGVLFTGRDMPDALTPLFLGGPDAAAVIRSAYARLGAAVTHQAAHARLGGAVSHWPATGAVLAQAE